MAHAGKKQFSVARKAKAMPPAPPRLSMRAGFCPIATMRSI